MCMKCQIYQTHEGERFMEEVIKGTVESIKEEVIPIKEMVILNDKEVSKDVLNEEFQKPGQKVVETSKDHYRTLKRMYD